MCNANESIITKVQELMELRKMAEALQAEMDTITDEIKAYMGDEETMMAGSWKVTWKETVSRRMDTKALKNLLGDALEEYYKTVVTRPFKPTTKDDIPAVFYKHFPAFQAGHINTSEFARICGLSRTTVYKYLKLLE